MVINKDSYYDGGYFKVRRRVLKLDVHTSCL
jgi:hypothetical protein